MTSYAKLWEGNILAFNTHLLTGLSDLKVIANSITLVDPLITSNTVSLHSN